MPTPRVRELRRRSIVALLAAIVIVLASLAVAPWLVRPGATSAAASSNDGASAEPTADAVDDVPGSIPPFETPPPIVGASAGPAVGPDAWRVAFVWHVPVLTYHLIATPQEAGDARPGLVVPPDLFRAQLAALRSAGWQTITAATLARDMASGTEPPPRTFVVTIDDGHVDGFTEAFPILAADGFVATYFVPTRRIDHPGYLSRDQLVALVAAGMEVANHTEDHVPLARVPPFEVQIEVDGAQAILADILGAPPLTLAYPYGSHDAAAIGVVGQAGIAVAFTTDGGCRESPLGRLEEPRIKVHPGTTPGMLLAEVDRCAALPAWG